MYNAVYGSPATFIGYSDLRLDPESKQEWLDALASDTYKDKQGRSLLATPDGKFCCLGVWCDLKDVPSKVTERGYPGPDGEYVVGPVRTFFNSDNDYSFGMSGSISYIPFRHGIKTASNSGQTTEDAFNGGEVIWSSWTQSEDGTKGVFQAWTLPQLNDEGLTFEQIADIIRYFL